MFLYFKEQEFCISGHLPLGKEGEEPELKVRQKEDLKRKGFLKQGGIWELLVRNCAVGHSAGSFPAPCQLCAPGSQTFMSDRLENLLVVSMLWGLAEGEQAESMSGT